MSEVQNLRILVECQVWTVAHAHSFVQSPVHGPDYGAVCFSFAALLMMIITTCWFSKCRVASWVCDIIDFNFIVVH